ncbi:carboxylate--amine ligase/circularly permuted type 2 ATP-grasp protein [Mumia sp. zg.B17]|uniref:carboxylate--amine ligase/circularly permuted type 2 ATP-grasp protein n=1 Tax=Mumia sp. zg.B17 TaxID=2855446 RepID=UPI001C6E5ECF|nr:carboxylate--amine ligase/circularly permuted type 2 ATP-grasp protein [Mumia sp. zg.B17]MBW9207162.1 carboxylate--amine ligase/circularly permuted type 2 ATP-grasp protein [Mumia sp. zg.B17]
MTAELTLGAEEELHLIDRESRTLSPSAPRLLSRLPGENFSAELQRSTIETNTNVVTGLAGLREELISLRKQLITVAESEGIGVAAVGTAPRSSYDEDFGLTATGRFGRMQQEYRLLVNEQLICGTQIHVGVSDRDVAIDIAQRIGRDLPTLLALSASSPYWNEQDTGYASMRTILWGRWPTTGALPPLGSAKEYEALLDDLVASGVIADAKMAYFDVRPSSHAPTLELRVADACPVVDDAILIAGLFRAMVRAAELDIEHGVPYTPVPAPLQRAATWQAARAGLAGSLLDPSTHAERVPAPGVVRSLIERLRPALEELGDYDEVSELAARTLAQGTSADRQRAAFAESGSLDDVMDQVVAETHGPPSGLPPEVPALRSYPARAGDEVIGLGSRPRPVYSDVMAYIRDRSREDLEKLQHQRDTWSDDEGLTVVLDGETNRFEVDLVPRIINAHEWEMLSEGLEQRARALEMFLQDVYGPGRALAHGVVAEADLHSCPGWREDGTRLPQAVVRAPIMGFDLVRNDRGEWQVLEDNLRNPSGLAYAAAAREMLDTVVPDMPRPAGLIDPRASLPMVGQTLRTCVERAGVGAGDEGALVLLATGPSSVSWYEHQRLAKEGGLVLATSEDLVVREGRVRLVDGDRAVDGIYVRLDEELGELTTEDGRALGAEIIDVAAAGAVVLANAPGNGVADDKATYRVVPELIGYYLDERPLIESVPTYRTDDDDERQIVLERVDELVTKPVDGYGGHGVLVGPLASQGEIVRRRKEIARDTEGWVAQETVALSSHPTLDHGRLEPRHVDLRVFVHVTGTEPGQVKAVPVALTRVAGPGSLIVNSSQGGSAKDTWIIQD